MSGRYDNDKLLAAIRDRREKVRETCENCGGIGWLVAAHCKSRNLTIAEDTETKFFIVHQPLHDYEHLRASNLKNNPCVARFLDLYGEGGFDPWPNRLEFTPKGLEHHGEKNDETYNLECGANRRPGRIREREGKYPTHRPSWDWEELSR